MHLRFDVRASSLPAEVQDALCALNIPPRLQGWRHRHQVTAFRSQEKNRAEAIERLMIAMVRAAHARKSRAGRRGPPLSQRRRVQRKVLHGEVKRLRGGVGDE